MINEKYQDRNIVNHYYDGDECEQVMVVGKVYDRVHIQLPTGGGTDVDINTIEPIPLTPEWLERCGFVFNAPFYAKRPLMLSKNAVRDGSGDYDGFILRVKIEDGMQHMVIKHLHHLQNIFHCLTGEELNVKL